jgi:hypothetical protein
MSTWWQLARRPDVVGRAGRTAALVGTVLIIINHGDALIVFDLDTNRVLKMLLTVCVPYCVSTYSSVGALRGETRSE